MVKTLCNEEKRLLTSFSVDTNISSGRYICGGRERAFRVSAGSVDCVV